MFLVGYLKSKSTKSFIKALKVPEISGTLGTKIIENRGRNGIYFHRLLALDFASWLDVEFRIWVILTIDKLLFAKNEKVAKVVNQKQNAVALRDKLIKQATEQNNTTALELLQVNKEIDKLNYQQRKALKDLTNQYEMEL